MALTKAEQALMRELAELVVTFAVRLERKGLLSFDNETEALIARTDKALWECAIRLEPPYH